MNLPLVLDIAIGIIFIYLTLSLLSSEIHELMTTLLQWRAEHLRTSIRVLLEGGGKRGNDPELQQREQDVQVLTERLYSHPLIRTLNQEAKGSFSKLNRKIINTGIDGVYRILSAILNFGNRLIGKPQESLRNPFANQTSAPSHIPAETFASTILETFHISEIGRLVTVSRLEKFQKRQVSALLKTGKYLRKPESQRLATERLRDMTRDWNRTRQEFGDGGITLLATIDRMENTLNGYIGYCERFIDEPESIKQFFIYELEFQKDRYYNPTEKPRVLETLRPTLNELIELVRDKPKIYQQLEQAFQDKNSPTYQGFKRIIDTLPDLPESLQNSLKALTEKIETRKESIEEEMRDLQTQLEDWFDKSMTRASGVYRRNSRGIAILIGFILAIATNSDTLFMIDSLSQNAVLRETVSSYAQREVSQTQDMGEVKRNVRDQLNDISLPIGWNEEIRRQQIPPESSVTIPGTTWRMGNPLLYLKRLLGWFISGIAISMGSSFWYDLLRKVIDVKNTGGKG
ncbi:MAG: hypothetical protein HLUCCO16_07580 [Phormidium sp. OSCR]|nr:MAG: hypothetical protein HLUCCO16_07580 [Phormidium sp. OSCR]